jgi:hypothetical protein
MNFLGTDLLRLIDEVLPARFGGAPTDYQFVEREDERGCHGSTFGLARASPWTTSRPRGTSCSTP